MKLVRVTIQVILRMKHLKNICSNLSLSQQLPQGILASYTCNLFNIRLVFVNVQNLLVDPFAPVFNHVHNHHEYLKVTLVTLYFVFQAVHVGDTIADIGMGRRAQLGATVGVLSGVGGVDDLDPAGADHIVPSIKHILSIALK